MIQEYDYAFKVVIVGNQGVGKSSIFIRFCDSNFIQNYMPTIGVDFRFKRHKVEQLVCKLQIWDTAGQQRFRTITSAYYRSSQAIIIVFDVSDPNSFAQIQNYWLQQAKNNSDPDEVIYLIGNKSDVQWKVDKQHVENFCRNTGLRFFYVSAKTGEGIQDLFTNLCLSMINASKLKNPRNNIVKNRIKRQTILQEQKSKSCCIR